MNHDQLYKTWSLGKLYEQEAYQEQHHSLQQQCQSIHPPPLQLVSSLWVKKCLSNNLGFVFFIFIFISTFSLGELKDVIAWF